MAHVLFPQGEVSWSWRLEKLCTAYSRVRNTHLRTLIGLSAQLLSHNERLTNKPHNTSKLAMGRYLATQLVDLDTDKLKVELYLLQPAWLPAIISSTLLWKLCNKPIQIELPSLRSLINGFVNISLEIKHNQQNTSSIVTSTPKLSQRPLSQIPSILLSNLLPRHQVQQGIST